MEIVAETSRLWLKVFAEEDTEAASRFWGDAEVMKQSGGATALKRLPKVLEGYTRCHMENGLSVYAVVEKATEQVIGCSGFNAVESIGQVELIYHFSKANWGKGYASEAVHACLELAKLHPEVQLVSASADPDNKGSLRILEKAGFTFIEDRYFEDTQKTEPYYEYPIGKL
ncbi:GNAT family N-acetyltransferase [Planococcus sp. YIM B11945]|uniref:GNAT family N-acetyltransferase n=1 Tax=Planococcus sp. YIM B11945 TaxID=3435410 RepID=UPI003D7CE80F